MAIECFLTLDAAALATIRKTTEDPPRISVYDLISAVVGNSAAARKAFSRLNEVVTQCRNLHKFPGSGQRPTPVVDARGAVEILMVLPGRVAAHFRRSAADVIVRYLGGEGTPALWTRWLRTASSKSSSRTTTPLASSVKPWRVKD
jgi:hypothetical protein